MVRADRLTIGYEGRGYAEVRNIIDQLPEFRYKEVSRDPSQGAFERIIGRLGLRKPFPRELHVRFNLADKEVDLFHFFNSTLVGNRPWGCTFETLIPYFDPNTVGGFLRGEEVTFSNTSYIKALSETNCKFLIAISTNALQIQCRFLEHFPQYSTAIKEKLQVLHPPQEALVTGYQKPNIEQRLNFMLVGSDLPRKGGVEAVRVFTRLFHEYPNLHLTLVGTLESRNSRHAYGQEQLDELAKKIHDYPDQISWYPQMSNEDIVRLMREEVHVGLLPTHADTYGYSVLEFQAAACPVITTNIRALPEINNNACGWLLPVDINEFGEAVHSWNDSALSLQNTIEEGLEKVVRQIIAEPDAIAVKGKRALERIKKDHDPVEFRNRLKGIYEIATNNN